MNESKLQGNTNPRKLTSYTRKKKALYERDITSWVGWLNRSSGDTKLNAQAEFHINNEILQLRRPF